MRTNVQLNRRDALKYGISAATTLFIPSIISGHENHLYMEIRDKYRKDPRNAFAIHHLDTICNIVKNEDIEFEYFFYEKPEGWCIKFHNKKVRKNIRYEPKAILDNYLTKSVLMLDLYDAHDYVGYYNMVLDKIENFERPKGKLINTAIWHKDYRYPGQTNIQVVEYQGLINGLEIV